MRRVRGGDLLTAACDSRHCAACDGRVTLALVGALFVSLGPLTAIFSKFIRFVLAPSSPPAALKLGIEIAVDSEPFLHD